MSPSGALLAGLLLAFLAVLAIILLALVRHAPRPRAAAALARYDFVTARAVGLAADTPEELIPAAVAARHLADFATARRLAETATRTDPDDGEAWLELALSHAYGGELAAAADALARAAARRSDLAEAVTLHRAWLALRGGEPAEARRLFDEVEVPLETKLRTDLGSGDPVFADWFLQAAELWLAFGETARAGWARGEAERSAPGSRLLEPPESLSKL